MELNEGESHLAIVVIVHIVAGPRSAGAEIHQQEEPHCPQASWCLLSSL